MAHLFNLVKTFVTFRVANAAATDLDDALLKVVHVGVYTIGVLLALGFHI
jgi:hypothetical protein